MKEKKVNKSQNQRSTDQIDDNNEVENGKEITNDEKADKRKTISGRRTRNPIGWETM